MAFLDLTVLGVVELRVRLLGKFGELWCLLLDAFSQLVKLVGLL